MKILTKINQIGAISLHLIIPLVLVAVAIGGVGTYVFSKSGAAAPVECINMKVPTAGYIQLTLNNKTGKNLNMGDVRMRNGQGVSLTARQLGWKAVPLLNNGTTTGSFKTTASIDSGWYAAFVSGGKTIRSNICTKVATPTPTPSPSGVVSCTFNVTPVPAYNKSSKYTFTVKNGTSNTINNVLAQYGSGNTISGSLFGGINLGNLAPGASATGTMYHTPTNTGDTEIYAQGGTLTSDFANCYQKWTYTPPASKGAVTCRFDIAPGVGYNISSKYNVTVFNNTGTQVNDVLVQFGNSDASGNKGALFGEASLGNIGQGSSAVGSVTYTPTSPTLTRIYAQAGTPTSDFANCAPVWNF